MQQEYIFKKLNRIGKEVFINILYPEILHNYDVTYQEIADKYPTYNQYTLHSQRSRLSTAKSIFREELVVDALKIVAESRSEGKYKAISYLESFPNL